MDKIKQQTPKHEAETCWNNSNKTTVYAVLNFVFYISRVLNFAIFSKSRNLVLAKFSENKVEILYRTSRQQLLPSSAKEKMQMSNGVLMVHHSDVC